MGIKHALLALGVAHLIFGGFVLYTPAPIARVIGFDLLGPGAIGEVRAVFGGLIAAMGLAIVRGSRGGPLGRQWLFAVALGYSGLFAGRVVSIAADGAVTHTLLSMAVEAVIAGFLLFAAGQLGSADSARKPGAERPEDVPRIPRADVRPDRPA